MKYSLRAAVLWSASLLMFTGTSLAQVAQLSGRVTDQSGAVTPAVEVVVVNVDTGVETRVATNDVGQYTIPSLRPGAYEIRVTKAGFKPLHRRGVALSANEKILLDLTLEIGSVADAVNVTAEVPILATENAGTATSITTREYNQLPLIQVGRMRQPANFLFLAPGVHGNLALDGTENVSATNQIQVAGSFKQTTEVLVDGLSGGQSKTVGSMNEMSPPVDAVQEFKVTSSLMSAEFGHTGSAVVNFTIKSGTNQPHGTLSHYLRNDKLDARNWFAPSRAMTRQNEFGGTIGAPIYIPKIYNGRDRSFFFFSYTGSRKRGMDNIERVRVATPQQIAGDFSGLVNASGQLTPIYDPATTRQEGSRIVRDPFPGNIIPRNRMDPVALKIAELIPAPNTQAGTLNFQDWIGESRLDPNVFTTKVDHMISDKQKFFVTANWNRIPRLRNRNPLPHPINDSFFQDITSRVLRFNHDYVAKPNLLNTLSLGFNRFRNPNGTRSVGEGWPEKLGLPGTAGDIFPVISFTNGYSGFGSSGLSDGIDNIYFLRDSITWTHNAHIIKLGFEGRLNQWNDRSQSNIGGSYSFNALGTGLPGVANSGDGFASFLLGQVQSASLGFPSTVGTRKPYWGYFIQDDWRITSTLTLNLGFRFEYDGAPYEAYDRHSIVDLGTPNPRAGGLPGASLFAGEGPGRTGQRRFVRTDYSGFGPRFGFAWRALSKTVVRGGYGVYYSDAGLGLQTQGFNVSGNVATVDNGVTPAFLLRNGIPRTFATEPRIDPSLLNDQNATYLEHTVGGMPRIQNWTFGIQREISTNMVFEASYIANHGTRLIEPQLININQVHPSYLSLGSLLTVSATSPQAQAAGIQVPYAGFNGSVAQALRAYPQYRTLTASQAKAGSNVYHSMELRLRKRLSHGLSFDTSYTWAKNLGYNNNSFAGRGGLDSVLQDNWNRQLERAVLPFDIPHAFLMTYVYDMPFRAPGALNKLASGWSLSGIHRYQSGNPLGVLMNNNLPIFNRVLRPDRISGVNPATGISISDFQPNTDRVINPAAFATPAPFSFGNSAPYLADVRNFPALSEDFSLIKNTPIREGITTEFITQVVNAFNRHRFGDIDQNFSNASFGRARVASQPRFIQLGLRLRF